jgi:hypothetical protein
MYGYNYIVIFSLLSPILQLFLLNLCNYALLYFDIQ